MKPIKFTEKVRIEKPAGTVFDFTQDYSRRLEWNTSLKKAELRGGYISPEKGAQVFYLTKTGLAMHGEYVSYNRPKVSAVKITKVAYMFRSMSGSWNFRNVDEHQTELTVLYAFELRFPFNLFAYPVRLSIQNSMRQALHNLKTVLEKPGNY